MGALSKCLLLFVLNWLDAQLTIIWVRAGLATEGNGLMASLLDIGNTPFLLSKLIVGASVAYVFYRFSYLPLARRGVKFALGIYMLLMLIHTATGLSALGFYAPELALAYLERIPDQVVASL
ncbi:MAG: hypothetical protein NVSMB56_15620 [Pyrinomonadaceae bacterium]